MSKKQSGPAKDGECVYCGRFGPLTDDHIPPKSLFDRPLPSDLITVESCLACNNGSSKDDEYFRAVIAMRDDVGKQPEAGKVTARVLTSLRRPEQQGFAHFLVKNMRRGEIMTPSGLIVGTAGAIEVDLPRINNVIQRIIKGLFFREKRMRLSEECDIVIMADVIPWDAPEFAQLLSVPPKVNGRGVFSYRALFASDHAYASAWLLGFYNTVPFACVVLPKS